MRFLDQMIRNGNVELQAREEEIRFVQMQMNEERRSIAVMRAQLPQKVNLEQELVTLQIQVTVFCHYKTCKVLVLTYDGK